jgi:NAD(P)-binding Rossmann-like domain
VARRRIAIVGGGASGVALAWCLTATPEIRREWDVTLLHDEDELGGHSRTIPVWFDDTGRGHSGPAPAGRTTYPVDIGVQFVCPSLYPNLYRQLRLPEFADRVALHRHPALRLSGAFGGDMVWGNFPEYQRGERFAACLDQPTRALAGRFERDLHGAWWRRVGGRRMWTLTVGEYLTLAGIPRDSNFVRYLLIPYLCIINGYGTLDLFETAIRDLFLIFTKVPGLQDEGPYGSFLRPGFGWDRFRDGATSWVLAMAAVAREHGADLRTSALVKRVTPRADGVTVEWDAPAGPGEGRGRFDTVVLTTDMTTNRELLGHPDNPHWTVQGHYLHADRFRLIPGACYIHQDDSLLAPELSDGREDGQFTGSFAQATSSAESDAFGLPYDLRASFQTYLMANILDTPYPCHVSMYAEDDIARRPDPASVISSRTWRHSRWVATIFREAGQELHHAQGLGQVFFAGNNTTVDSEEGALLSAMIVAKRIAGYEYPFPRASYAHAFYRQFATAMFPAAPR